MLRRPVDRVRGVREGLRGDAGFSSVPLLVAVVPILVIVFLICVEALLAVYAWARADIAAHAAAEAAAAGGDPTAVAEASLSEGLLAGAEIDVSQDEVSVSVSPQSVIGLGSAAGPIMASATVGDGGLP